jgi:16S rRNA (cytosine967-C5)-methyltransferase
MAGIEREGFQAVSCKHSEYGLNVTGRGEIFATEGFKSGAFDIQDESSQLFAAWCDPQPNHILIDACAGSGGKSLYFSAAMRNKGKIIASDPNQRSLEKLSRRAARAGSGNIEIVDLRNSELAVHWKEKTDKVVIDAPCSGLGTLARNPDIKWRFDPETFSALAAEQLSILSYFSQFVKAGGELVYGTCTLNPDENEHVIRHFLSTDSRFEMRRDYPEKFKAFIDDKGFFYIQPFRHGLSGFFGCKLIRK